ncbi:hypothetical protein FACS1894219_12030 [Clostridia bacterium]|nr:hypothetical protein FACS1894219_12030 [Clostridia bacterium]
MVKDIRDYVSYDIAEYLEEVGSIVPQKPSFEFQQTLDFVFSSVLLKMTGCLEHKIDMISLRLAEDDEKIKQNVLRSKSDIPQESGGISGLITKIRKSGAKINGQEPSDLNCWEHMAVFDDSIVRTVDIINNLNLHLYLGASYNCLLLLKRHSNIDKELKDKTVVSTRKRELQKEKELLNLFPLKSFDKYYQITTAWRNHFAHNEFSVYRELRSPRELSQESILYDNWCFRFVALVYADKILRDEFNKYLRIADKYRIV